MRNRRWLVLVVAVAAVAPGTQAFAAPASLSNFGNAGPGQMKVTVNASVGGPCPPGALTCSNTVIGAVRPVGAPCERAPNDPFYYNVVFSESLGRDGGIISKTYTFSPGDYKDATGSHPIPSGPILLCAYARSAWILDSGSLGGTEISQIQGFYGATSGPPPVGSGPTGQRAAALKKCKRKHGRKRKKCRRRAKKLAE